MALGDRIEFFGGSYEVRGVVNGRIVVRVRNRLQNKQVYKIWTEAERDAFDQSQRVKVDKADRNAQIYERHLSGETKASLAREFNVSASTITQICGKQARKENARKP